MNTTHPADSLREIGEALADSLNASRAEDRLAALVAEMGRTAFADQSHAAIASDIAEALSDYLAAASSHANRNGDAHIVAELEEHASHADEIRFKLSTLGDDADALAGEYAESRALDFHDHG